jgi:hypothetical protein
MLPIHDLFVRDLQAESVSSGERLHLVGYSDHLLRRFGEAELLRLEADRQRPPALRQAADELWALIRGSVEFELVDRREGSPSVGQTYQIRQSEPAVVLVPFGVEFVIRAVGGSAELIRFTTHEEHGQDE